MGDEVQGQIHIRCLQTITDREIQGLSDVLIDCDEDTVLVKAERLGDGNVCHTGNRTCFYERVEGVTIP